MKNTLLILFCLLLTKALLAQQLRPGFDKSECIELLQIGARFGDSIYFKDIEYPAHYKQVYHSNVTGLDNRWDLWTNNNGQAVVSIRGTTTSATSWLANFYAAMVPAKGTLRLSDTENFDYELSADPKAAVHVGWLLSVAFLSKDILLKIDSLYKTGTKEFIITGHSQGGAITFLLTSYLYSLQKQHKIPSDIRFKTYCFAAPKPGNLYYAYEYEHITQSGWAYNVVNSADWVPETPLSVQTVNDFNETNPFLNAKIAIRKMGFPKNLVLRHVYNRLDKPTRRAQRRYQKILGKFISKSIMKSLPGFKAPFYFKSSNYVRVGVTIVLMADEEYYKKYPNNDKELFRHHFHKPYLYLADKLNINTALSF